MAKPGRAGAAAAGLGPAHIVGVVALAHLLLGLAGGMLGAAVTWSLSGTLGSALASGLGTVPQTLGAPALAAAVGTSVR